MSEFWQVSLARVRRAEEILLSAASPVTVKTIPQVVFMVLVVPPGFTPAAVG